MRLVNPLWHPVFDVARGVALLLLFAALVATLGGCQLSPDDACPSAGATACRGDVPQRCSPTLHFVRAEPRPCREAGGVCCRVRNAYAGTPGQPATLHACARPAACEPDEAPRADAGS